jgi:homoserine kinase type II
MVVKTNFTGKDFAKILSEYDLGSFVSSKSFRAGVVQTNILVKTTKGKYVLRYYETRNKKRVLFESELLDFLSKNNYPSAAPIKNLKGKYVGTYNKKEYMIFEYISGRHIKNLNEKQFHEMIKNLAFLHKLTKNYNIKHYVHEQPRTVVYCLAAAKKEAKKFKDKKKGKERFEFIKSELQKIKLPKNMPKSIIHCDFDKQNLKFNKDKLSGVLDFDDSYYDYRIHDVGILILFWAEFLHKKLNFNDARNIVKTYEKYNPLTQSEKEHIYDAMQFASLMIMAWIMYDKWKGKDLFSILSKLVTETDKIGRDEFYNRIFENNNL